MKWIHLTSYYNYPVTPQSYTQNGHIEVNRNDWTLSQIVPDDHLIGWVQWTNTTADEGKIITAEQHLDMAQTAFGEYVALLQFQWVAIENTKTIIATDGKATYVYVEIDIKYK